VLFPALALALLSLQAPPSRPAVTPEPVAAVQDPSKPKPAPKPQTPKPSPPPRSGSAGRANPPAHPPAAKSGQPRGTGEPKLKRRGR
jgi:hypothetical protein